LEKVDYSDKDLEKEREADEFASKWTLTNEGVRKKLTVAQPSL
jgi:HTH-type transcriptional regulator / antitoxin HigA